MSSSATNKNVLVLSNVGVSPADKDGAANEWQDWGEVVIGPTKSWASYQKIRGVDWLTTFDPSAYPTDGSRQILRDGTARLMCGVAGADDTRAWGAEIRGVKLKDVKAYVVGVEVNTFNFGNDCIDPNDSRYGFFCINSGSTGTAPSTVRLRWGAEGGQPSHYGLHVQAGALTAAAPIINSENDQSVVCAGASVMLSQIIAATKKTLGLA